MKEHDPMSFCPEGPQSNKEIESFPGVYERRHFLSGSVASFAALVALQASATPAFARGSIGTFTATDEKLSWDEFLTQSVPIAKQLIADSSFSIDEYLYRIGSLATRLKELPESVLGSYKPVDPRVWFGPSFRGSPFFIIQWRMEPGAILPTHNHPNASVCTLGFEGEARVRNFQIVGEPPEYSSNKVFHIRETRSEVLTSGKISTLSPSRDNMHGFEIGKEGARGIDINTMHGPMGPFSFLNMNDKPVDSDKRIFEVTWNPQLGQMPRAAPPKP